jgi:hypothetical protein
VSPPPLAIKAHALGCGGESRQTLELSGVPPKYFIQRNWCQELDLPEKSRRIDGRATAVQTLECYCRDISAIFTSSARLIILADLF